MLKLWVGAASEMLKFLAEGQSLNLFLPPFAQSGFSVSRMTLMCLMCMGSLLLHIGTSFIDYMSQVAATLDLYFCSNAFVTTAGIKICTH